MSLTVECPSGLSVSCREFKVRDENLLSDKKARRKGTAITDLIQSVVTEVHEFGPYSPEPDGTFDWAKALTGDRTVLLLKNRIETWGHEYLIHQPCANLLCREPTTTEIDLRELPIKELPEASMEHVRSGLKKPLQIKLPKSGAVVAFRLLRGLDDKKTQKLQKQKSDKVSSALIQYRTLWIKEPDSSGQLVEVPPPKIPAWIEDMSGRDSSYLRAAYEEFDCGVNTSVQFECPECDHMWRDDVRLAEDFLFPKFRGRIPTSS